MPFTQFKLPPFEPSPSRSIRMAGYVHGSSHLRVVFAHIPGPLVSTTVVVPTVPPDQRGLPHTLEHLVFCGSELWPHRGYLDALASRQLSDGTNAYTAEDHTAFTITTTSSEGTSNILPVFLDHILHPTLSDEQFTTEVYHANPPLTPRGVVYSEMSSREYMESDLLDRTLRSLLYTSSTPYAYECGGITSEIAKLTNDDVRDYHRQFYRPERLTVVIAGGGIDENSILNSLDSVRADVGPDIRITMPETLHWKGTRTQVVPFMSAVPDVGSIGIGAKVICVAKSNRFFFRNNRKPVTEQPLSGLRGICFWNTTGWLGPPTTDLRTIVALEVILRYFHETAASPIVQRFVERNFATAVDCEVKYFLRSCIVVVFSGVPVDKGMSMDGKGLKEEQSQPDERSDEEEESDNEGDIDSDDQSEESESNDHRKLNLGSSGCMLSALINVFHEFVRDVDTLADEFVDTLDRHRTKIYEAFEDNPHDVVRSHLIPDLIYLHFGGPHSSDAPPRIGTRTKIFSVLDGLKNERPTFWGSLVKTWFIDAPVAEVIMIPDPELGLHIKQTTEAAQRKLAETLGAAGVELHARTTSDAIIKNKVQLPTHLVHQMPSTPAFSSIPQIPSFQSIQSTSLEEYPFGVITTIQTDTLFIHLKIGLSTDQIPDPLRPYLVLFQELLLTSALNISGKTIPHAELAALLAKHCVSHESSLGFANDTFQCSWLSEVFMIDAVGRPERLEGMMGWVLKSVVHATFTRQRVRSVARRLLCEVTNVLEDPEILLSAIATRVSVPLRRGERGQGNRADGERGHDIAISIFVQRQFLKGVLKALKSEDGFARVSVALERIKDAVLGGGIRGVTEDFVSGFVSISTPLNVAPDPVVAQFLALWKTIVPPRPLLPQKRPLVSPTSPLTFPFPRTPVPLPSRHRSLCIPRSSLTASHAISMVPCDLLDPVSGGRNRDYWPVLVLCEVISRNEGPLYEAIRGTGLAYEASLVVYLWSGQIAFELHDASDAAACLGAFAEVLRAFEDGHHWDGLDTAKAICAYQACCEQGTAAGVIETGVREVLRGYASGRTYVDDALNEIPAVTVSDLKRVFEKFVRRGFLEGEGVSTVLITPPNPPLARLSAMHASFEVLSLENLEVVIDNIGDSN